MNYNPNKNDIEFVKNLDVCEYKKIQSIAKNVLDEIRNFIKPENTEKEIVEECKLLLKNMELLRLGIMIVMRWFCLVVEVVFLFLERIMYLLRKKLEKRI